MSDTVIPDVPVNGAVPPWAIMGVQLLEALMQRLKADDPPASQGGPDGARRPALDPARLERSCRMLSRRLDRLAGALGACRCWGRNPACRWCAGQGRPGALEIDAEAFQDLVLPLFRARPELFLRHVSPTVEVVAEQQQ